MTWNSPSVMTVVDLIVIAFAVVMLLSAHSEGFFRRWSRGRALIVSGALVVGAFYVADLALMYAGPPLVGAERTAELLGLLRRDVLHFLAPLGVGLTAAGLWVTNRARLRDERRLSLMADALPLAVAYIDLHERYRFANAYYARLHGRRVHDVVGAKIEDIAGREVAAMFRDHSARVREGRLETYQRRARLPVDAELRDLHSDLVPDRDREGAVMGYFLLLRDETKRVQLEREVVRAAEAERMSVARDLHDSLGQSLTGISLALSALARKLDHEGSRHVPNVTELIAVTQQTIGQTRQFTHLLAPTMRGGLFGALRALGREVSTLYDVECIARSPPEEIEITTTAAMHLYRIAQESVNNALRHGRAESIYVDCRIDDDELVLEILDNGRGIPDPAERVDGLGLNSMYYRARMIGGLLRIERRLNGGTEVSCRVPTAYLKADTTFPARRVDALAESL